MMNCNKNTVFCLFFLIIASVSLFSRALERPDYVKNEKRIFFEAQEEFDRHNYGDSLSLLEQAKKVRRNKIAWEIYTLENSLKPAEVKRVGNNLNDILRVLQDRQDYDAIEIIHRYAEFYGLETFDYSAPKLLEFIRGRSYFPEADYLSGQIYKIEGEYEVAKKLFLQAYERRSILDVPEMEFDILYSLSDISLTMKEYDKYEEFLVAIVSSDRFYNDKALLRSMMRTISSTDADGMERFFKMYRANDYKVMSAYFYLSEFYQQRNEKKRSLDVAALGVLTAVSKIYSALSKRNPECSYTNLADFLDEAALYEDIVLWGQTTGVWKGFNDFAESAYNNGCETFAMKLYEVLKDHSPEYYWKTDASIRYNTIVEKANN